MPLLEGLFEEVNVGCWVVAEYTYQGSFICAKPFHRLTQSIRRTSGIDLRSLSGDISWRRACRH